MGGVHTRYVQRTHCCESPVSWMDLGRYSSEERPAPSGAGPHFCPGPATVFGLLCILASPVPNKNTDRRRKSHRPGTMRYQTLLGMAIISKNNRVFALSPRSRFVRGFRKTKKQPRGLLFVLERKTRLELATPTLARSCSTN